jgi:hypothetical protein
MTSRLPAYWQRDSVIGIDYRVAVGYFVQVSNFGEFFTNTWQDIAQRIQWTRNDFVKLPRLYQALASVVLKQLLIPKYDNIKDRLTQCIVGPMRLEVRVVTGL